MTHANAAGHETTERSVLGAIVIALDHVPAGPVVVVVVVLPCVVVVVACARRTRGSGCTRPRQRQRHE